MDEPEELTSEQRTELHTALLALRDELTAAVAAGQEASKPVTLDQSSVGRLSRMDAMQVQQMAKANLQSHQLRLEQVSHALRLFDTNAYGYCRRCEEPIGFRRLQARPETPFCLRCQGASETR